MLGDRWDATPIAFGQILRTYRLAAGMSQERLALDAGVQRNFVSLIERGHNQPTISTLMRLAGALDVGPDELIAKTLQLVESMARSSKAPRLK